MIDELGMMSFFREEDAAVVSEAVLEYAPS